jgi:hypothetical protein
MGAGTDLRILHGLKEGDLVVFSFGGFTGGGSIHVRKGFCKNPSEPSVKCYEYKLENATGRAVKRLLVSTVSMYVIMVCSTLSPELGLQYIGCADAQNETLPGVSELFIFETLGFLSDEGFTAIKSIAFKVVNNGSDTTHDAR